MNCQASHKSHKLRADVFRGLIVGLVTQLDWSLGTCKEYFLDVMQFVFGVSLLSSCILYSYLEKYIIVYDSSKIDGM